MDWQLKVIALDQDCSNLKKKGYSFVSVWKVLRVVHFEGFPKNNDCCNNMSILHGHIAGSRF